MLREKYALDGRRSCSSWVRQPSLLKAVVHAFLHVWPTSLSVQVTSARWTLCCVWAARASLAMRRNIWAKQQNYWSSCWTTRPCSQQKPVTRADTSVSWYTHTHVRKLFSFLRVPSDLCPPFLMLSFSGTTGVAGQCRRVCQARSRKISQERIGKGSEIEDSNRNPGAFRQEIQMCSLKELQMFAVHCCSLAAQTLIAPLSAALLGSLFPSPYFWFLISKGLLSWYWLSFKIFMLCLWFLV